MLKNRKRKQNQFVKSSTTTNQRAPIIICDIDAEHQGVFNDWFLKTYPGVPFSQIIDLGAIWHTLWKKRYPTRVAPTDDVWISVSFDATCRKLLNTFITTQQQQQLVVRVNIHTVAITLHHLRVVGLIPSFDPIPLVETRAHPYNKGTVVDRSATLNGITTILKTYGETFAYEHVVLKHENYFKYL